MSEGHQSKLLRTDTLHDETEKWSSTGKWKKKRNGSKKPKRMFVRTENKIKDIMPTNTHTTELMLQERNYIHQFENY